MTAYEMRISDWSSDVCSSDLEHAGVDTQGHFRRVAGTAEGVERLTNAQRLGIDQMEALAIKPFLVCDVIHGIGNVIHRHHVDASALDAQGGHPLRQGFAQFLDQGEEIIWAIDLVDLAADRKSVV